MIAYFGANTGAHRNFYERKKYDSAVLNVSFDDEGQTRFVADTPGE